MKRFWWWSIVLYCSSYQSMRMPTPWCVDGSYDRALTRLPNTPQTCSMELKSRLWSGCDKRWISTSSRNRWTTYKMCVWSCHRLIRQWKNRKAQHISEGCLPTYFPAVEMHLSNIHNSMRAPKCMPAIPLCSLHRKEPMEKCCKWQTLSYMSPHSQVHVVRTD